MLYRTVHCVSRCGRSGVQNLIVELLNLLKISTQIMNNFFEKFGWNGKGIMTVLKVCF